MDTLLALLLLLNSGGRRRGNRERLDVQRGLQVREVGAILQVSTLAEQKVGLTQIVDGERLDQILNSGQTSIDLFVELANALHTIQLN